MRRFVFALALVLAVPAIASAEWQAKGFAAIKFGGSTTFSTLDQAGRTRKFTFGGSGLWLGEVIGFEGEFAHTPGYFDDQPFGLVTASGVTTVMGNVIVAMPRRLTEYTLRPYFVGGLGLIRSRADFAGAPDLRLSSNLLGADIGGGATGFFSRHVGVSWDLRHFWTVRNGVPQRGFSLGEEQIAFWRVNMSLVVRF